MDDVQRRARLSLLEARRQLEALEAASTNSRLDPVASADIHASFRTTLTSLERDAHAMRQRLPPGGGTQRVRLADLEEQLHELRVADARVSQRFGALAAEASVREELFRRRGGGRGDVVLGMGDGADAAAAEARSLQTSGAGVTGILATGAGALDALVAQRATLKGARRKVMDVVNTMAAGRKVIARIERRDRHDTLLLYALMAGILLLLALAVAVKHHRRG